MKPKVIIVDNNRDVCRIYEDTLNFSGYSAKSVCDEEIALEVIDKEKPDLVLLDILMPKISGLHLLKMIKGQSGISRTKVVILTELTDSKVREKAYNQGAKDYIIKSETDMKELLFRIGEVLDK